MVEYMYFSLDFYWLLLCEFYHEKQTMNSSRTFVMPWPFFTFSPSSSTASHRELRSERSGEILVYLSTLSIFFFFNNHTLENHTTLLRKKKVLLILVITQDMGGTASSFSTLYKIPLQNKRHASFQDFWNNDNNY